jgi:spore maturation protein CgeB
MRLARYTRNNRTRSPRGEAVTLLGRNLRAIAGRDADTAAALDSTSNESDASTGSNDLVGDSFDVIPVRTGAITLRVRGRLEASAIDPERDGERRAEELLATAREAGAHRIVVFGVGLYTLRYLAEAAPDETSILVVEPSVAIARAVLSHIDLAGALARIDLVVGDDVERIVRHPTFAGSERGVLLSHAPARHRARALHDDLTARFAPAGERRPLDIAVVPPLYGGSLPVAHAVARALRGLGHRVREIDLSAFEPAYRHLLDTTVDLRIQHYGAKLRAALVRTIGESVVVKLMMDPPDVVFALAQAPLDVETLAQLRRRGIVCSFWFCEDAHVMPYWREVCTSYDLFFHLQPDVLSAELDRRGVRSFPLPMAYDPELHKPVSLTPEMRARYDADVSFIGAAYHNRVEWLPGLEDFGLRIYGTGWPTVQPFARMSPEPNVRQSTEETNLIFNATRINVNLHSSPWTDGVNPAGDYLNPRVYEIAGAAAFQLVDERSHLPAAFAVSTEIETFRDLRECRAKIRHYLAHPNEATEIARLGRARALAEHTYRHRMRVACEVLRAELPGVGASACARPTVGSARESVTGEHPGLARILARVPDHHELTADVITAAVARGEGELSDDEKMLLFMREAMSEVRVTPAGGDAA